MPSLGVRSPWGWVCCAVGSGSGFEADWQAFLCGAQYLHSELFLSIPSFKSLSKKRKKSLRTKGNKKLKMVLPCIFDFSAAKALPIMNGKKY